MLKILISFTCLITLFSCSKKLGPEDSLRQFVTKSIRSQMSKADILEATTGNLKNELEALNEEDMEKYLKIEGASDESLRINLANCEGDICFLTYTLKYKQSNNGEKTFDIELKKMAEMKKVDDVWLLADVTDIKTYYEAQQPIEP